jgi:beta-galactosidase
MKFQLKVFLIPILLILLSCTRTESSKPIPPILFNNDWQFVISADSAAVFDPTASLNWETVQLPHTPRIEPLVVNNQWQGTCWYRKDFMLPPTDLGAGIGSPVGAQNVAPPQSPQQPPLQYYLQFDGAMNVADVWINGVKLAHHLGGFLPFTVDFTEVAIPGQENHVVVRLDNTDNPITGPKPLKDLDFNTYGGLYRDVYLILKNPVHITDPVLENKPGSGGIFVTYPEVSTDLAVISVKTSVQYSGNNADSIEVRHRVLDRDGVVVTYGRGTCRDAKFCVPTGATENAISTVVVPSMVIQSPNLWSPQHPYLYTMVTEVYRKGILCDIDTTRIGIRRFEITRDHFRINGEEMFLRGVNRHQEYPYVGYALSDEAQYRDAKKIKDAGFDYVRLSHYPQSPAFMDACDELGLLVLDAIPGWQYFNPDPAFQDQAIQTCRDMIRRDRNHPCVLAWEVSLNESWMPEPFIDRAIAAAREEYPGDQCFTAGWQNYGYDIYLQARQHRWQHYQTPDRPYIVSEYGDWEYYAMNAGFEQGKWQDLLPDDRSSRQLLGAGEKRLLQQATNIQEAHNDNFNTPAFADGYWVMYDYNRGYTDDLEASGIMSIFREPKFSYYFFQSQRAPDEVSPEYVSGPMIRIASYWDEDSSPDIRVFSNCEEVELSLNDEVIGRQSPDTGRMCNHLAHPPFTFHEGRYVPGKLIAKGYIDGKEIAADTVATPGDPFALKLKIDESGRPPKAGVNDIVFIYAVITDKDGNPVPVNGINVKFTVTGDAIVLNPGGTSISEAGSAAALVRIGDSAGDIRINAEAPALEKGNLTFKSH